MYYGILNNVVNFFFFLFFLSFSGFHVFNTEATPGIPLFKSNQKVIILVIIITFPNF